MNNRVWDALKPYRYDYLVSVTAIMGSGSYIIVFASIGDFHTACLTHDFQVVWVMTCGGQEVEANSDRANELHKASRELYHAPKSL